MRTLLLVVSLVAAAHAHADHPVVTISRHHKADMFTAEGSSCSKDFCVGSSSGTAGVPENADCTCQCLPNLPVFREDLHICINDIHECPLAPFVSGSTVQRIPFVFLPLKGQIVYPSAEISFAGTTTPICVVSGAQFLTRGGWVDLHNNSYTEPPFRLFRDEGRTFLQWLGETDLRLSMEGRLMLVHLMCKDVGGESDFQNKGIFTPCVAFRVAGTPSVREVVFAADAHAAAGNDSRGLSVSEYIAIAVCSILLGLIYVASVFLYLHMRRRRGKGSSKPDSRDLNQIATHIEEGIVKSNPLLHTSNNDTGSYLSDSISCCSDTDNNASDEDASPPSDLENSRMLQHNIQVTSAMVHSCGMQFSLQPDEPYQTQDSASIERLPEENVSIVETPEVREDRPETVRAITNGATARRKLYFNPAYFEPELLLAPPPAAIEFLTKIREVIAIAKHKMMAKRFSPTLMGIPEEDVLRAPSTSTGTISLKRENGRIRGITCSGCPGCTSPNAQRNCEACSSPTESKQSSIRKWLEDVPVSSQPPMVPTPPRVANQNNERSKVTQKGKAPAVPKIPETPEKESSSKDNKDTNATKKVKSPPPPPLIVKANDNNFNKKLSSALSKCKTKASTPTVSGKPPAPCPPPPPPPPPMPSPVKSEASEKPVKKPVLIGEPAVKKQLMDAVIKEMVGQRGRESATPKKAATRTPEEQRKTAPEDYEADSLERACREQDNKGMSTPSDYGEATSQPSPSLSSALPLEEELTMRNEIFNKKTGNKTISKLKLDPGPPKVLPKASGEDHEYEIIVLNPDATAENASNDDVKLYTLPELLSHSDGYSLVSEVYVNDGYSFSSASSSPSNTSGGESAQIRYSEKQGHLTIQVEDSPDNYLQVPDESDSFEPDTLDRKPNRIKTEDITPSPCNSHRCIENYVDSLERPAQILLRTTGSFRSDSMSQTGSDDLSHMFTPPPLTRAFGSLREIYEARTQHRCDIDNISLVGSTRSLTSELDYNHSLSWKRRYGTGVRLNPEAKQARRQRSPTPPGARNVCHKPTPPDVVPPLPPKMSSLYEDPPPPRPLYTVDMIPPLPPRTIKPPLPPKNAAGRSTSQKRAISDHMHRPLPPLPQQLARTPESHTLETISNLSGASEDSLNSSDYEPFYMAPASGDEEVEGSQTLGHRLERSLQNKLDQLNSQFILHQPQAKGTASRASEKSRNKSSSDGDTATELRKTTGRGLVKHLRDKNSESVKKTWRRMVQKSAPHKPEDSGYLSTDSNESHSRVQAPGPGMGSVSETDESETCDGASESGAESIATDSFFFGSFRGSTVVTESVDSGVGSDLLARTLSNPSRLLEEGGSSSDSENVSFVTVLPPGSGRHGRSLRC